MESKSKGEDSSMKFEGIELTQEMISFSNIRTKNHDEHLKKHNSNKKEENIDDN